MIFEKKQADEAFVDSVISQLAKDKPNIGFDYTDFAELKRANEIIAYTGSKEDSDVFSDDDFVKRYFGMITDFDFSKDLCVILNISLPHNHNMTLEAMSYVSDFCENLTEGSLMKWGISENDSDLISVVMLIGVTKIFA